MKRGFFARLWDAAPWIIDGITAITALGIVLYHYASPMQIGQIANWLLVVLFLIAVSGVTKGLGVTKDVQNTAHAILNLLRELVEHVQELMERVTGEPFLKEYDDLLPFKERLKGAKSVWLSGRTLSSVIGIRGGELKRKVAEDDCEVRVLIVDPDGEVAQAESAKHYHDEHLRAAPSRAATTIAKVEAIRNDLGPKASEFQMRKLDYSPRFSLLITDPNTDDGVVQVQLLSHLRDTDSRPIMRLKATGQQHWVADFIDQFGQLWEAAEDLFGETAAQPEAA